MKIKVTQWLAILFFASLFISEFASFFPSAFWVIKNNQITNWGYWYLFVPIIADILALYGLYKIVRFKILGFKLMYIAFALSAIIDTLRGTTLLNALSIIPLGNLLLFLLFHYSTKSIKNKSK